MGRGGPATRSPFRHLRPAAAHAVVVRRPVRRVQLPPVVRQRRGGGVEGDPQQVRLPHRIDPQVGREGAHLRIDRGRVYSELLRARVCAREAAASCGSMQRSRVDVCRRFDAEMQAAKEAEQAAKAARSKK